MLENFESIQNPLVKGGLILFALCLFLGLLKVLIFIIKTLFFKPKRQPSVRERFELLTDHECRQKTGFEQKYRPHRSTVSSRK
ncbi:MAG: hypothetical protein A2Y12_08730 [Planctomycetes bacterium GWF2_42_9]|nr:MAG: hypothetical protein A2Y12_08730 [Planctomycetes bacterium GWF2_42_9]HAL45482.1 hypothetical protein [Phycisphaerales bacterium]